MQAKYKLIIGAIALLAAFAIGRYLSPTKVVTETKVVEIEKKSTQTNEDDDKHKETTTKEVIKPDGTKETTTTTVEDDKKKTSTSEKDIASSKTDTTKEVSRSISRTTLSALGGVVLPGTPQVVYGGMIQKDVLGPFNIGVYGLTNKTVGASVGISF